MRGRLALLCPFLFAGCALLPSPVPMTSVRYPMPGEAHARCLVILLPGFGDRGETFKEERFVDALHASGVSADLVGADATMGYYFKGVAPERLDLDVVRPARAPGYEQVWLIGISMGGFGAFEYTQQHSEQVDGVLALAPYLGARSLAEEIRRAGGLAAWTPDPVAPVVENNYQRQLWSWLHRVVTGKQKGPIIYLGFGDDDGLGAQDSVLGQALPPDHVLHTPGGHDWPPWRDLLAQFLQASDFSRACARK